MMTEGRLPVLTTERLVLRPETAADLDAHGSISGTAAGETASGEVQLAWTEPIAGGSEPFRGFRGFDAWTIARRDDATPIGRAALTEGGAAGRCDPALAG